VGHGGQGPRPAPTGAHACGAGSGPGRELPVPAGKVDRDYLGRLHTTLTSIRGVNRTDVVSLGTGLGTLARVLRATRAELEGCPGIGPTKARRLYSAFHEPFRKKPRAPAAGGGGGVAEGAGPGAGGTEREREYVAFNRAARAGSSVGEGPAEAGGAGAADGGSDPEGDGDDARVGQTGGEDADVLALGVGDEAFEGQEGEYDHLESD